MSAGAAIAVAVSVASDVRGCVDERGYLELMPVPIRNIREGLGKVDVFAAADIDSRGGNLVLIDFPCRMWKNRVNDSETGKDGMKSDASGGFFR